MSIVEDGPLTTPVEVIYAAADYMEAHGKATGVYSDAQGRVSIHGALCVVDAPTEERRTAMYILRKRAVVEGWASEMHLSDSTADKRKVIRFMRRAAQRAESGTLLEGTFQIKDGTRFPRRSKPFPYNQEYAVQEIVRVVGVLESLAEQALPNIDVPIPRHVIRELVGTVLHLDTAMSRRENPV